MMTMTVKNQLLDPEEVLVVCTYMCDIDYTYKDYSHKGTDTVIYFNSPEEDNGNV